MHVLTSAHTSDALRVYVLKTLRAIVVASDGLSPPTNMSAPHSDDARARIRAVTQGLLMVLHAPPHPHSSAPSQHYALRVRCAALELLGQLAFNLEHRRCFLADARVLTAVRRLAQSPSTHSPGQGEHRRQAQGEHAQAAAEEMEMEGKAARRVLAILGDNQFLGVGMRGSAGARRGARILVVDGGGVKGIASIRMLNALEQRCGQPLHSLFDLIVGTSAGGIIVSGIASGMEMPEIQRIYSFVVKSAFSAPKSEASRARAAQGPPGSGADFASARMAARSAGSGGWSSPPASSSDSGAGAGGGYKQEDVVEDAAKMGWWSKLMASSSSMKRVLFQGAKYDAAPLLAALKTVFGSWSEQSMIEDALEDSRCKTAIVSTLVSERPVRPYIFRSYQLPPQSVSGLGEVFGGTCQHTWLEAMRASSAAPYFFDEFSCRGERYQDGAIVANNPSIMSLHEAQRLWPGRRIELMVSVGTGKDVVSRRDERASWGLMETFGEFMIESATSSDRVQEAVEVFSPLVPDTSFYRLQVEDSRCNIEIDDTSLASAASISRATDEFVADSPALFGEIAALLTGAVGSDATCGGQAGCGLAAAGHGSRCNESVPGLSGIHRASKTGVGAPLHVLVLDMRLPCAGVRRDASTGSMAALLDAGRISYTLHSFSTERTDQPGEAEGQLNAASQQSSAACRERVVSTLLNSTARLVHFECDLLPSGGDLVLQWVLEEEVVLQDHEVRQLLQSSTSHHHLVVDDLKCLQLADSSAGRAHGADSSCAHENQASLSDGDAPGQGEGKEEEEEDFGPWVDHSPLLQACKPGPEPPDASGLQKGVSIPNPPKYYVMNPICQDSLCGCVSSLQQHTVLLMWCSTLCC